MPIVEESELIYKTGKQRDQEQSPKTGEGRREMEGED